jgi:hypothetical protein
MEKRKISPIPEVVEDGGAWKFRFTRESFQKVFDELYDAETIEIESSTKWSNADPIDTRDKVTERGDSKKSEKSLFTKSSFPRELS